MDYIYDILLNISNKKAYDFFEWNQKDEIINLKKSPVIRIDTKSLIEICNYKIKFNNEFLKKIENQFLIYKQAKRKINYIVILSDTKKAIGITINSNGVLESRSTLLIEEEEEILSISEKLNVEKIEYKKLSKELDNNFLTRKEEECKKYLLKEINTLYQNNEIDKLRYLYIEYFNEKEDEKNNIYKNLISSLKNIDKKHQELYQILKKIYKR